MPLGKPLLSTLDRIGHGGLILDTAGQVLQINDTAQRLLGEQATPGHPGTDPDWARQALKTLLRSQGASRFQMDEDAWIVIQRANPEPRGPLILHAVPISASGAASGPHTVVILVDLDAKPQPTLEALQKIFSLSPAEGRLAVAIAAGNTPEEISEATQVSIATVRKQLASVFAKTNTRRQPELVALLAQVSILP